MKWMLFVVGNNSQKKLGESHMKIKRRKGEQASLKSDHLACDDLKYYCNFGSSLVWEIRK